MFASLNTLVYDVQTYYIIITGKISENIFAYEIFLSLTYPGVANLVRLGISVCNYVSARSQYLVTFLSMCWITSGHTMHPPIEEILTPPSTEPTSFRNCASKVAGQQVLTTIPGFSNYHSVYGLDLLQHYTLRV